MFFDNEYELTRILLIGVLSYLTLVLLLRFTGKRTLSKWNAFDFVVTIAFGSMLASVMLSKDITYAEGTVALALLVALQYLVTWLSVRVALVRRLVKADPCLLLHRGVFQEDALRRERVTRSEVRAAIRAQGVGAVEAVEAVVLETDGTFSVIEKVEHGTSALTDVNGFPGAQDGR